jgi:hypothetical protein
MKTIKSIAFAALLAPVVAGYGVVAAVRGVGLFFGALYLIGRDGLAFGGPVVRR